MVAREIRARVFYFHPVKHGSGQSRRQEHAGGVPDYVQLDVASYDNVTWFDYDEVDRRLANEVNDEATEPMQAAGEALSRVMEWIGADSLRTAKSAKTRAAVVQYMLRPDTFKSQSDLARSLGVSKQHVNALCISFRDTFGYRNTMTRSDRARRAMRDSYVGRFGSMGER